MIPRDRSPLVLALQHPFAAMLGFTLLLLFAGLGQGDVRVDGAIYAWVSKWMVVSGDWMNLYFDRGTEPYFNKPPLQFWLIAITYQLFGVSDWSAKLITPLFGTATVVLTYLVARHRFSPSLAATAGIVLVTTYTFFRHAVGVRLDPGVATSVLLSLYAALALLTRPRGTGPWWTWPVMGAAWGCGMLLKSPVVLLALPIILGTFAWQRRLDLLFDWRWLVVIVIALAIVSPWYLQQYNHYGQRFIDIHFGQQMASRFQEDVPHAEPWWFYLEHLATEYWPWLPLAVFGFLLLARKAPKQREPLVRMLVIWIVFWFVVAHLVTTKYERYLIPWFPAVSIAAAYALSRTRLWPTWKTWVLPNAAVVCVGLFILIEIGNVRMHRTDSPALQEIAPLIAREVAAKPDNAPVIHASGLAIGSLCRLRFYTDAEAVPREEPGFGDVPAGDYIALQPKLESQATLPAVEELGRDRRVILYRVLPR